MSETMPERKPLRGRVARLRNAMLQAGVGRDRFDEMMGSPEIVLDVAIAYFYNRRHTDAAPGEAELGRELIAWAAEPANVYACDPYTVPFCLFCGLLDGHTPTCLHLRARALREESE